MQTQTKCNRTVLFLDYNNYKIFAEIVLAVILEIVWTWILFDE